MRYLSCLLLSLSLLLGAANAFSQDAVTVGETAIPILKARVTDLTGTLAAAEQQALEQKLAAFEQRKGSQLAVLIVPNTGQETIEQFGIRVAAQWKLGRKGTDDGLILIVAKADRTLRIEVGYGLEGVIPDAIAKRVISEVIVPKFKTGDFAGGIDAGLTQLMSLVDGEPLPAPERKSQQAGNNPLGMLLIAAMVGGQVLRSVLGPVVAGGVVGAGVFGAAWLLTGTLGIALLLGFGGFFVTLLGIMGLMANSGFGGGGRGGMGGGGFGEGFGGGGGGFGGGGASGRW